MTLQYIAEQFYDGIQSVKLMKVLSGENYQSDIASFY